MIPYKEVMEIVFAQPFRPFRIRTTGGKSINIRCQDTVALGRSTLTISTFLADDLADVEGPWYHLPLTELEAIEYLGAPVVKASE